MRGIYMYVLAIYDLNENFVFQFSQLFNRLITVLFKGVIYIKIAYFYHFTLPLFLLIVATYILCLFAFCSFVLSVFAFSACLIYKGS